MIKSNNSASWALKIAGAVLAGLGLSSFAGCQMDSSSMTDFFPPEDAPRATQQFQTVQAASGARNDATLQPLHFDGERLNSLGEAKLDLLLKDDDTVEPVVLYMNVADKDSNFSARKDAVTRYLDDRGLPKEQVKFETGPNPNTHSLAVTHVAGLVKQETSASSAGGVSSASMAGGDTK
jgi:hypothetical protein